MGFNWKEIQENGRKEITRRKGNEKWQIGTVKERKEGRKGIELMIRLRN
jgi:hypothetical protein